MATATQGLTSHPAFSGLVHYRLQDLSEDPMAQVRETIGEMRANALQDAKHPLIEEDALVAGGTPDGIWSFVHGLITFTQDADIAAGTSALSSEQKADTVEVLIRPVDISIMRRQGKPVEDCDGFATYAAAMLLSLGIPVSFVTVAADASDPTRYSHVYIAAYPEGKRIALDCSHGDYPGWECPDTYHMKKEWPITACAPYIEALPWLAFAALIAWGFTKWR